MVALNTDMFSKVGIGTATTLTAPGHTVGGDTFNVVSTSNWPTDTGVVFAIDATTLVNGVETRTAGTYTEWEGVVTGATTISNCVLRYGTDQNYASGSTTRIYIPVSSSRENRLIDGLLSAGITQSGGMGDITPTSIVTDNATITNLTVGSQTPSPDWTTIATPPDAVTYNGQRSYNMVFNGVDYTNILSPGQRLKTTRTVAAPTQCTSLNGTTQYWNKTSPNKLTFTDDFVVDAYVKMTSYGTTSPIASRYDGTSGWSLQIDAAGAVQLIGYNAAAANNSKVTSYQSIPLNKWVRVTAQLDMSTFTATTTTSYIMIDGVDVPASVTRAGTNPTAILQAGNLEIGSRNGGTDFFPGKIAQVAIYNAKVTQANIILTHSQGLSGSETSLASAYSFNGVATDLNTTTPNNLTAQASAGYAADSPFGTQASGLISSTLDYGIVQSATFSTNTTVIVQVPEGCTIPTSGGVSAVSYSGLASPYGFRELGNILGYALLMTTKDATTITAVDALSCPVNIPVGRKIRVTATAPQISNGATTNCTLTIWDGVVNSGTRIASGVINTVSNGYYVQASIILTPSSTSKTYNVGLETASGTCTLQASTVAPASLTIELV